MIEMGIPAAAGRSDVRIRKLQPVGFALGW